MDFFYLFIDKNLFTPYNQIWRKESKMDIIFKDICNFLPKFNNYNFFNVINTVHETNPEKTPKFSVSATYKMYIITEGEGIFRNERGEWPLKKGDVLIMPPSKRYSIENTNNLSYIYASYLGTRAVILMELYDIAKDGEVFKGLSHLIPMWYSMVLKNFENAAVACEGVVLYTFSEIGSAFSDKAKTKNIDNAAHKIKNFIDKSFSDPKLSLEKIAAELNYHPKYVSHTFQKEFKVNVNNYVKTLRIQNACALMEEGITSIKDISRLSGFSDSLYFSTVFKKMLGSSPKEYIKKEIIDKTNTK